MKLRMKFEYELWILVRMNWKRMWLIYGMIFIFFFCEYFFKEKSIQYFIIHLSAVSHLSMSSNMIMMWPFIPLYGWIAFRNIVNACWVVATQSPISFIGPWATSSWFFFYTLSYAQFNGWVSLLELWKMV